MPAKRSPRKPKPEDTQRQNRTYHLDSDADWGGFINIRLTDDQKLEFSTWYEENVNQGGFILDDLLGQGMKVGFSYDDENQCYICTFTGALVRDSAERWCMTTRASTFAEVIALSCWKHVHLAHGEYGGFAPKRGNFPNWG